MRRKTSFFTGLALAATVVVIPSTAHADATVIALTTQFDKLSSDRVATVTLKAKSPSGITNVAADVLSIVSPNGWTQFATLQFKRVDGTDNNGTWQAEFRSDIEGHPGTNRIGVRIESADGATLTRYTGFINCYQTSITDLAAAPSTIDIEQQDVTVRGRVMLQKSHDAALEPASGATVRVSDTYVNTATDGSFTVPARNPGYAGVHNQSRLCSKSQLVPLTRRKQDTVTSARIVTPQPIVVGDKVTVQGKVLRKGSTGLVPASDVPIDLYLDDDSGGRQQFGGTSTAEDGTFLLSVTPRISGRLTAVAAVSQFLNSSTAEAGSVQVRQVAKITGFNAGPEPLPYGDGIDTHGTLTDAAGEEIVGAPVVLEYSADGKTGWRTMYTATTSHSGEFYMSPSRITRDGHWRARFAGNASYAPAVSWVDHVDVKYRTYLYNFNASPEPVKKGRTITVKGLLYRFMDEGVPGPGATIYIYFKPSGSTAWKQMAVTKTAKDGWFRKTFTASKDGTWMATDKGSATYFKSNAPSDYVDVR